MEVCFLYTWNMLHIGLDLHAKRYSSLLVAAGNVGRYFWSFELLEALTTLFDAILGSCADGYCLVLRQGHTTVLQ